MQTDIAWTVIFPAPPPWSPMWARPSPTPPSSRHELGIPAVVGCGDATARLRTGDRVLVDGGAGTVTVMRKT